MKTYDIIYGNETVGSAVVTQEGLYYNILCRCALSEPSLYRIFAIMENTNVDLGICLLMGKEYFLKKKVPKKMFGSGIIHFCVRLKDDYNSPNAYQVVEGEPFKHIDKLGKAHLEIRNNEMYVVTSQSTDQL